MGIKIDGVTYNVGIIDLDRKFDKLYKYAERTENGVLQKELIGVYYNFPRVTMGASRNNIADYYSLIDVLTDTEEFHNVTMPNIDGTEITFEAYFDNIADTAVKWVIGGIQYFRGLTFAVIARSPARTP